MNTQNIITRLRRIEGQMQGIVKMIESDKGCIDVVTQFKASRAALDSAMSIYLDDYAKECIHKKDTKNLKVILKEIIKQ
jgi:DNA-binding FrmR family transcriptional regulator